MNRLFAILAVLVIIGCQPQPQEAKQQIVEQQEAVQEAVPPLQPEAPVAEAQSPPELQGSADSDDGLDEAMEELDQLGE